MSGNASSGRMSFCPYQRRLTVLKKNFSKKHNIRVVSKTASLEVNVAGNICYNNWCISLTLKVRLEELQDTL